jgi:hypothetical protein
MAKPKIEEGTKRVAKNGTLVASCDGCRSARLSGQGVWWA